MRAVVDANVLLASIAARSPYRWLFDARRARRFDRCLSTEIAFEYEEVLDRRSADAARTVLGVLAALPNVHHVEPSFRWRLVAADPDDDKYVDAAVAGSAPYLVTHDRHFAVLRAAPFPRLAVVTPEAFRAMLAEPPGG